MPENKTGGESTYADLIAKMHSMHVDVKAAARREPWHSDRKTEVITEITHKTRHNDGWLDIHLVIEALWMLTQIDPNGSAGEGMPSFSEALNACTRISENYLAVDVKCDWLLKSLMSVSD